MTIRINAGWWFFGGENRRHCEAHGFLNRMSLRGAQRRGNPFSHCEHFRGDADCHTTRRVVRNDIET